MPDHAKVPTRAEIQTLVATHCYGGKILNNAHRGDVVEIMVLTALGDQWKHVGLGWHPWDLQRGSGQERVRIQVKQTAAVQLWGRTRMPTISFGWKPRPPAYFVRDNPDEAIETEGCFCDVIVIGIHEETDEKLIDQLAIEQWRFLAIPRCDLPARAKSMSLVLAKQRWLPGLWSQLPQAVEAAILRNATASL